MVKDNEKILNELIAQRQKIDDMISSYKNENGELMTVVEETDLEKKEYSFGELVNQSLGHTGITCGGKLIPCNIEVINIDNSVHITNNHLHESRVNTTLAGGDSVINALGGLFRGLLD